MTSLKLTRARHGLKRVSGREEREKRQSHPACRRSQEASLRGRWRGGYGEIVTCVRKY